MFLSLCHVFMLHGFCSTDTSQKTMQALIKATDKLGSIQFHWIRQFVLHWNWFLIPNPAYQCRIL